MQYSAKINVTDSLVVDVQAKNQKELFGSLAKTQEIFGEKSCGLCGCEDIVFKVRVTSDGKKTYEYYEMHCQNAGCYARLAFGQALNTEDLFPKRRLGKKGEPDMEDGEYGKHRGWTKYKGEPKA